jgi:hypothetical protein
MTNNVPVLEESFGEKGLLVQEVKQNGDTDAENSSS